jgi:class 3 adenylate cyclase
VNPRSAASPAECACCGTQSPAGAKFCSECGASFIGYPTETSTSVQPEPVAREEALTASAVERRPVTLIFCDLVGSTPLGLQVDVDDYHEIIVAYHSAVENAVAAFGGDVARKIGDGVLICFGYPFAHEDDVERAIQCALRIIEDIRALSLPARQLLRARIGVATGLVVVRRRYEGHERAEVVGESANLAARLQTIAEPNTIVVSSAIRGILGDLFEWRDLGLKDLKGIPEPVRIWQVVGGRAVASRFDAQRRRAAVPMLGRDDERTTLRRLWGRAREGAGQVALIRGEAGVGKSRLAAAALEDTAAQRGAALRFFCSEYRQGTPLHPCIQHIEHAAGFTPTDSAATRLEKLKAALRGAPDEDFALVAELMNLPGHGVQLPQLTPPVKRRRLMRALLRQLEHQVPDTAALVIFEDAQWSDETSRELLASLVSRAGRLPILLLVLARPDFDPGWKDQEHVSSISLAPLDEKVSAELVRFLARDRPLTPQLVDDIVARTDGLPLYLEEVTETTIDIGNAPAEPGPSAGSHGTALPFLLQSSLLSRLDRLGGTRKIAEVAAAVGRDFTSELLALVVEDRDSLDIGLERLVESGIVIKRPDTYRFRHALIRDAAYRIMARDDRRAVHRRIAEALETHFPEFKATQPEILALHYSEAREPEKGVPHWLAAAQGALLRSAMAEGLRHSHSGVELIAHADDSPWRLTSELKLTILKGMAQIATQGYAVPSTRETFAKARALCAELKDPPELLPQVLAVMHGLWTHDLLRADFASARRQAEQVLARGQESGDPMWLLMGHRFTGVTHHPLGEFDEATRKLQLGLDIYDPAKREIYSRLTVDDPRVVMLTYRSWSLMCLGKFEDARRESEQAVTEAREMKHAYTMAHALNGSAFVSLTIDTPEAGMRRLDELDAVLADHGVAYYEAVSTIFRGYCLAAMGRFDAAMPLLVSGMSAYRATSSRLYLSGFLRMSAEAHTWAGRGADALELVQESLAIMDASDQRWDEAEIHRVHGLALLACGDERRAEEAFRRAYDIAHWQGAKLWELRAAASRAELPGARGMREALGVLGSVVACFDPSLSVPDLQRARKLLSAHALA